MTALAPGDEPGFEISENPGNGGVLSSPHLLEPLARVAVENYRSDGCTSG